MAALALICIQDTAVNSKDGVGYFTSEKSHNDIMTSIFVTFILSQKVQKNEKYCVIMLSIF